MCIHVIFLACHATCGTCTTTNDASKCLNCPVGKYHSNPTGTTEGTCSSKFSGKCLKHFLYMILPL